MAIFHTGITLCRCFHFIFCLLNLAGKPILETCMTQFKNFFLFRNHLKGYQLALEPMGFFVFLMQSYPAKVHKQREIIIFLYASRDTSVTTDNFSRITVESHISLYINTQREREREIQQHIQIYNILQYVTKDFVMEGKKQWFSKDVKSTSFTRFTHITMVLCN